ncbi:MAG: glycosyltransferase [Roseobacter sp.]
MIFATVGTQLPFDRLLSGLNSWAMNNPEVPMLAQSGASKSSFPNLRTVPHLGQKSFKTHFESARLVVAHAGMGSILAAAELGKPIILMPRLARLNEHRNDHQQDTANEMARLSNVTVVHTEEELHSALDLAVARNFATGRPSVAQMSRDLDPLIDSIRDFVWTDPRPAPAPAMSFWKAAA